MTHHGVKQNTLSPFGQEIVCGNPTVHRWISEEPNFSTGHSVPIENPRYSSGARRTGPHLAHAKTNSASIGFDRGLHAAPNFVCKFV